MAIYKKGYYDLYMFQGDTGNITIKGIPVTANFSVYLQISKEDGTEIYSNIVMSEHKPFVIFPISANVTDNVEPGTYTYAVKLCCMDPHGNITEETVIPPLKNTTLSPTTYKNKALFLIYPKQIEGVEEW